MRAHAPLGRLVGLAMLVAGLGTAAVATPEPAAAAAPAAAGRATTGRPTAIGLAGNGTTYIGFSSGSRLQRITAEGKLKGSVPLDQDEVVDGLFVTKAGDLWVDYETSVSLLSPRGHVKTHFAHRPARSCGTKAPATRYGGITAYDQRVYVANRCTASMSVYTRTGHLVATVKLPGRPRGIGYGVAQSGRPALVYVAIPDRGQVLAFKARGLSSKAKPASRYTVKRFPGNRKPAPGGLAIDRHGQLTVTDMANNALYLLDTNNRYSLYRTLGHPPHASRAAGRLNGPGALAQHPQDGGGMSGNYFIADTDNRRVQRWSTGGYTYWSKGVRPGPGGPGGGGSGGGGGGSGGSGGGGSGGGSGGGPGGPGGGGGGGGGGTGSAPVNQIPPSISGTPAVGATLTCNRGTWYGSDGPAGSLIDYSFSWQRDGATIPGASGSTYAVVAADDGADLTCTVVAMNSLGSTTATSAPVTIGSGGGDGGGPGGPGGGSSDVPVNTALPAITGTPAVGQVLTCSRGTWTGTGITYAYQWRRAGVLISGATSSTYTVVTFDQDTALTCTVTATSAGGSRSATSPPVTVGATSGGPVNTAPPTIVGTALPGQVLTCDPGTWAGAGITYTYLWRRTTTTAGVGATYPVTSDDVGAALTCAVTATTAGGSTTATSAPVTVSGPSGHAPANTTPPAITGTAAVGGTLACNPGVWTGTPTYAYLWRRDGLIIAGATGSTYVAVAADAGANLTCTVVATNGSGSAAASSAPVTVAAAGPPTATTAPALAGTGAVGTALTCAKGTWTGAGITFTYVWTRDGVAIPDTGADRYVVLSDDQGAALGCTVTARNSAGTTVASTATRTVPAPAAGAPVATVAPGITGTASTGQTLTCDPGTWTGDPTITLTTVWQRDGATVATGPTYLLGAADSDATLRCVVVATNPAGRGAARSAAVGGGACNGAAGVTINGGDAATTSPVVQLSIRPPTGATTVLVSNHADLSGATAIPLSGTCTYAWTLDAIPGLPLTWSVYVQFDTDATIYSDSILVDQPAARPHLLLR